MSLRDATIQVLQEANGPLHYREICKRVLAAGLWATSGKTPEATLSATLASNKRSFSRISPGVYELKSRPGGREQAPQSKLATPVTYLDAAEIVLRDEKNGIGMHYRDITSSAIKRKLIATKGLTPEATMSAQLGNDIQRRHARGEAPRFTKVGRGLFSIAASSNSQILQLVDKHNHNIRMELHSRLKKMDPGKFEELAGALLVRLGFEDVQVTGKSNDGGIDVIAQLVVAGVVRTRMAVQVKRYAKNFQSPVVQMVRGSLGVHDQGLIITTGGFLPGAREEASKPNAVVVSLMDGHLLVEQLIAHDIGVEKSPIAVLQLAPDPTDISPKAGI
jgi:restriction system protein